MNVKESNQAVILDVPFISWEDERLPVGEMNPSDPASYAMIFGYWRNDVSEFFSDDNPEDLNDWIGEAKQGKGINDLKPYIDNRIPIIVRPTALTPFAHPINPMKFELGLEPYPDPCDEISGSLLGLFVPLDYAGLSGKPGTIANINEDFLWSSKVVVGYNDSKDTVYLHDPTFGPYWPISYNNFEKMWEAGGRGFSIFHPRDFEDLLAKKSSIGINASRSTSHQATLYYIFGYVLSSIGRNEEAEIQLRKGLEINDVKEGYSYLLNLELGMVRYKKGDLTEAMTLAKKASKILPEHHASWFLQANLSRLLRINKLKILLLTLKAKKRKKSRKGSRKLPRNMAFSDNFLIR